MYTNKISQSWFGVIAVNFF